MTMARRALVFALLFVFSAIGPASAQGRIVGVASVIDGDTIEIHGQRIGCLVSTPPKAASFACDRPANAGVADNVRALRWPIGSDAPP